MERALSAAPEVTASSLRVKFGGLLSNYVETTTVRLNGVDPEREFATAPLLSSRITKGDKTIRRGEVLLPQLLAAGLKVGVGDTVVIIATNREGSVNAMQLKIGGVADSVTGPSGRDGYLHVEDARQLLRMETPEVSEIAIRVKRFGDIGKVADTLRAALAAGMPGALYLNAALTGIYNRQDGSFSLTQETSYRVKANLELRTQLGVIAGRRETEFGEKLADVRFEFRARYYF